MCSWYQPRPRPRLFLAALGGTAPGHAEMKVYIFICCKVLHSMYFTKQSQAQIYSINIFGGRMSLSKTEECFLNSRSYDSWNQEVISLELKESTLMYIHAVVLCTQAIYYQERIHIWVKVHKWHLKLHNKIKTHSAHDIWRPNSSHDKKSSIYHTSILPKKHSSGCTNSSDTLQWHKAHDVYVYPAETQQMISQPAGGKVPPQWKQCSA